MTRNEWICRGCEDGPDDIVLDTPLLRPVILEYGFVRPGSPQVAIAQERKCDRCGKMVRCFKRTGLLEEPEKAPEVPLEEGPSPVPAEPPIVEPEVEEPPTDLTSELEALKARIAEIEKARELTVEVPESWIEEEE